MADNTRGIVRWAVKTLLFSVIVALALFLSAGSLSWTAGWAYLGMYLLVQVCNAVVLLPTNPELLVERSRAQEGTKSWDQPLAALMALAGPILMWVVAGLDFRLNWSAPISSTIMIVALVAAFLGGLITLWAMYSNKFFSGTVRIQEDRGHEVVSSGPYRTMRHPGYVGAIIFYLATPLALGSLWAYVPALLTIAVVVVRTNLEDQTLQAELPGYQEYASRVRYRLLPGVW